MSDHRDRRRHPPCFLSLPWWRWRRCLWIKESFTWPFAWISLWWTTLRIREANTPEETPSRLNGDGDRQDLENRAVGCFICQSPPWLRHTSPLGAALFCRFGRWDRVNLCLFSRDLQGLVTFTLVPLTRPYFHGMPYRTIYILHLMYVGTNRRLWIEREYKESKVT